MLIGENKGYREKLLYEGMIDWAKKQPDKTAVYGMDRTVSYAQLLSESLGYCKAIQNQGICPGDRVIVNLKRGISQIEAILGVLMAGAVYVPVGAHQPAERIKNITEQSAARMVISEDFEITAGNPDDIKKVTPEHEAYIIFTSGSTGRPKGVIISHKSAMNTIDCVNDYFRVNEDDKALAVSQIDFDLSVYDIFGMLSSGGSIVLLDEETAREPQAWKERIKKYGVTLWNSVPALFDMLITSFEGRETFSTLKKVFLSGDWIPLDIFERMKKVSSDALLVAMGGATEASIWSNYHIVTEIGENWVSVPYGVPLADQSFIIMDESGNETAEGETGELWIGGKGVAIGYTDKELTDKSFVKYNDEIFYRTGDYGRLMQNGEMEFCGRRDQQVKLNGFRVELGEIERVLLSCEGVAKAAAAVKEDKHIAGGIVPFIGKGMPVSDKEYPLIAEDNTETSQVRQIISEILEKTQNFSNYENLAAFYRKFSENGNKQNPEGIYMEHLAEMKNTFSDILSGRESVHKILEDDIISPESASMYDHETMKAVDLLIREINSQASEKCKLKAAIAGTQKGLLAEYIIDKISGVNFDVITGSSSFASTAGERLGRFENCRIIKAETPADYHELYASYDIVISVHGLHTYKNETMAGRIHTFMLKNNGKLYAVEQKMLKPEAYLTSMLIENGFSAFGSRRMHTMNPMFPPEEWKLIFESFNMTCREIYNGRNVYLLEFINHNHTLNADYIYEFAKERLPYYMVPDSIYIVPEWNYSGNGKVKKDFFVTSSDVSDNECDNFEGIEAELADLFKSVLKKENISRNKSFFEMGGDSLLLTRLLTLIKDRYQIEISMKDAYDKPYISEFASRIEEYIDGCGDYKAIEEGEI